MASDQPIIAANLLQGPLHGDWLIHPVINQAEQAEPVGGVLWPGTNQRGPFAMEDLDPLEAIDHATDSMLAALTLLPNLPDVNWLAVPVHPRALGSARSWWRKLSHQMADLSACREACGRRLVLIVVQAEGIEQMDSALLRNLAELHTLALALDQLCPAALRTALSWPIARLFLGAPCCVGIDTDRVLQQQWLFLSRAASGLHLPVTVMGVQTASELAWLRRQGAREVNGSALANPIAITSFAAHRC